MNGDEVHGYASPACLMHEVDPAYGGGLDAPADVHAWRRAVRGRLLAARLALPREDRTALTARLVARLDAIVACVAPGGSPIVAAYWPFRGEPDLRPWLLALLERGWRAALPLVVAKRAPLVFRPWTAATPLTRGVWGIPIPAAGEYVVPDVIVAPLVGFDAAGFRLGYGGGFYDRTLAAIAGPRTVIGVGYAAAELPTIHPQAHDVPMDYVLTERETRRRA